MVLGVLVSQSSERFEFAHSQIMSRIVWAIWTRFHAGVGVAVPFMPLDEALRLLAGVSADACVDVSEPCQTSHPAPAQSREQHYRATYIEV